MKRVSKALLMVVAMFIVLLISPVVSFAQSQSHTIEWGLKHRGMGHPPDVPSASVDMLSEHKAVYLGDINKKEVYLTFDLGYESGNTAQVLDILKRHNIKAIFFLCGHYLSNDDIIDTMISDGHSIGNHTNRHKDLVKLNSEGIERDIAEFDELHSQRSEIRYFRPPYGRFDNRVLEIASKRNLKTVLWSSAILDWGKIEIDPVSSSDKLVSRLHNGNIMLLHITNAGTPKMLELLIPKIIQSGYTVGDATSL